MFENEILNTGEKIRKLREIFKITQADLSQKKYKRNYISMIENNKENLSLKAAENIAINFNTIAKNKNIDIKITAEWLLETKPEQAKRVISLEIEKLKKIEDKSEYEKMLSKIELLAKKYNLNYMLPDAYIHAADYYFYNNTYCKSNKYCEEGFDIAICHNKSFAANFLVKQSRININSGNYDEAIRILKHAYRIVVNSSLNENTLKNILFNLGLSYSYKNEVEKCIYYLEKLSEFELSEEKKYSIEMLKATTYLANNNIVKAKEKFIVLLNIAMNKNNIDDISQCYRNLAEVYFKANDYRQSEMYILKSIEYKHRKHGEHLYFCAKVYTKIDTEIAKRYIINAYNYINKNENLTLFEKILYLEFKILIEEKNEKAIEKVVEQAIEIKSNLILFEMLKYKLNNVNLQNKLYNIINTIKKYKEI